MNSRIKQLEASLTPTETRRVAVLRRRWKSLQARHTRAKAARETVRTELDAIFKTAEERVADHRSETDE